VQGPNAFQLVMMHLTLSSLLCSELSFVCNQAAEVDYRLVTVNNNLNQPGHEVTPCVILGFQLRNRNLAAWRQVRLRAKEQVDHGLLEAVQILCGEHGSKIRSIRCCRAGIHYCNSRVAISSRHLSVFVSFLFLLVQ
jgi:hypothetical protein